MPAFVEIHEKTASVVEAVRTRHSVREYEDRPVSESILRELFEDALRAPSWKNSQPWQLHILTGEKLARMSRMLVQAASGAATPRPDTPWLESYPTDARKRMFDLGMQVYGVAGIDRKDKPARDAFMLRNFEFFGAPAAVFITTKFDLNFFVGLDIGCLLESILLLARAHGLGTCPQAALGAFPDVVRSELGLGEDHHVVCGLSIGYPKSESDLNRFHAPRESFDSLVKFYD